MCIIIGVETVENIKLSQWTGNHSHGNESYVHYFDGIGFVDSDVLNLVNKNVSAACIFVYYVLNNTKFIKHSPRICDACFFCRNSIEADPSFDFAVIQVVDK